MKMLRHTITGLVPVPNANINASADNSTGSTGTSDAAPSADSASGPTGPVEVMGLLLGFPRADGTVVVTDAFPLPVRGIEYRVEAAEQVRRQLQSLLLREIYSDVVEMCELCCG